jgi:hypothetical protein
MMTIARIWKTGVDPERALEYEQFAREVSLPMFQAQEGFEGVFMLRDGADCTVITLWKGPADAAAQSNSTTHKRPCSVFSIEAFWSESKPSKVAKFIFPGCRPENEATGFLSARTIRRTSLLYGR